MKKNEQQVNRQPQDSREANPPMSAAQPVNNAEQGANEEHSPSSETRKRSTVSPRKIESNRGNSRQSTGPKTAAGKRRVSMNAVRHGFFSKFLLVQHPDGKESQSELDKFYASVRKHYQPVGFLEELWTEKIAVWSWRLRRLIRCESGQIARALAEHSYEIQQSKADDLAEPESAPSRNPEMDAMTDHLFLPENEELDKLLRYEAMINRQLNHAITELERVQARRKGVTI
jgi:hypothetical protein